MRTTGFGPPFRSLAGALLLASLFPLAALLPRAAEGSSPEGDGHFSRGRDLLLHGKTEEAEASFRKAVQSDPAEPDYLYYLATAQSGRVATYGEAERNYRKTLEIVKAPSWKKGAALRLRAASGLGRLLVRTGRAAEAIPLLRGEIAGAPDLPRDEPRSALALAYYEERMYDEAIFELRHATRANPLNSAALFNLKTLRTRLEPYQAGKIYSRVGNHEGAVSQFRKAIQYDPRFIGARLHLGTELLQSGKAEEAVRELHRAESVNPSYPMMWEIWYGQGQALAAVKRNREALAKYRATVEARPKFAPAHYEMGSILESEGQLPEAAAQYALAIEGDPRTDYVRRLQSILNRLGSAPPTLPPVRSPSVK